jgi:hypothetical protein
MNSEAAILERIIEPQKPNSNRELAEYLLSLDFKAADHERMRLLSEKAQAGTLSNEETRELDSYLSMGHFLALLQSKARITLKQTNGTAHS